MRISSARKPCFKPMASTLLLERGFGEEGETHFQAFHFLDCKALERAGEQGEVEESNSPEESNSSETAFLGKPTPVRGPTQRPASRSPKPGSESGPRRKPGAGSGGTGSGRQGVLWGGGVGRLPGAAEEWLAKPGGFAPGALEPGAAPTRASKVSLQNATGEGAGGSAKCCHGAGELNRSEFGQNSPPRNCPLRPPIGRQEHQPPRSVFKESDGCNVLKCACYDSEKN